MRNLKRVLSLAMAALMLMGMMVVSAGAASTYDNFVDKDEIVNDEAVNTIVSLGVMEGKPGDKFDPTATVKRGEMAKIIAKSLNGGKDPVLGDSTNIPKFSDVPADHWAYKYIAYCVQLGIIAGHGDGTFAPEAPVTGSQAAKMYLCALGYRADLEGLVGAEWELNTNILANQDAKLYEGLESINPSQGLNRDNTAQMCYNAIQAVEVMYDNLAGSYEDVLQVVPKNGLTMLNNRFGVVKVEGIVVANDVFGLGFNAASEGKSMFRDTNTYRTSDNQVRNYNGVYPVDIPNEYVGQRVVIYVKFPNALAPNAVDSTVIGEPILSNKNTVATTGDRLKDADAVKSFLRDNGLSISNNDSATSNDGNRYEGVKALTKDDSAWNNGRITTEAVGVNGTAGRKMTFIDHTGDGTVDYIITENPTLAQVTVYDETNKELTIAGEGSLSFKEIANPEAVAKGDMALYVKYDDTYYLSIPETVTGAVTAFVNGTPTKVTMDGTNYTQSANGLTPTGTTLERLLADESLIGNSYVFYLDAYGNVVAKDLYEEEFGNYALVIDCAAGTANNTNLANSGEVKLMLNDGTTAVYKVNMLASAAKFEAPGTTDTAREQWMANMLGADGSKDLRHKIVTYVVDGSNVTIGNPGVVTNYRNVYGNSANPVQRSTASYNITDANGVTTNVIVNDSTLFYVMSDSDNTPGVDRFSLIQGLSNVPVSVVTGAQVVGAAYQTRTVDNHVTNTAKAVVVQDLQNSFKGTRNFLYVTGNYTQTNDQMRNNIYQYPVVFESGETGSILVKNTTNATVEPGGGYSAIKSGMIYEYRMNGDYAELFLTASTYNNYVTSQVSGKSMEIRLGTNGSDQFKDTKTLGTTVINVEDTDKVYVMDNEPTAAMSVAFATNSDGYVNLVFVRDSDVHFRTVYNTTGMALMINDAVIPNGGAIQVANGFNLTIKKADGSAIGAANAKDQVVIYAHNDNSKDSEYQTGNINSEGYGVIGMPANSTVILGSLTGNKTFSTTIPDGTTTPDTGDGTETVVGNITFVTDKGVTNVYGTITTTGVGFQFVPDVGGTSTATYAYDWSVKVGNTVLASGSETTAALTNGVLSKTGLANGMVATTDKVTVTISNLVPSAYTVTATGASGLDFTGTTASINKSTTATDPINVAISGVTGFANKAFVTVKVTGANAADVVNGTNFKLVDGTTDTYITRTAQTITGGAISSIELFTKVVGDGARTLEISLSDGSDMVLVNYVLASGSEKYATLSKTSDTVAVGATSIANGSLPTLTLKNNVSKFTVSVSGATDADASNNTNLSTGANISGSGSDNLTIDAAVVGKPITVTITVTPTEYTRNITVIGTSGTGASTLTFDGTGAVKVGNLVTGATTGDKYTFVVTSGGLTSELAIDKTYAENSGTIAVAAGDFTLPASALESTLNLVFNATQVYTVTATGMSISADSDVDLTAVKQGTEVVLTGAAAGKKYVAAVAADAGNYAESKVLTPDASGNIKFTMPAGDVTIKEAYQLNYSWASTPTGAYVKVGGASGTAVTSGEYIAAGVTITVSPVATDNEAITTPIVSTIQDWTETTTAQANTPGVYTFTINGDTTVEFVTTDAV